MFPKTFTASSSVVSLEDPKSVFRFNPLIDPEAVYQTCEYIPKKESSKIHLLLFAKAVILVFLLVAGAVSYSLELFPLV